MSKQLKESEESKTKKPKIQRVEEGQSYWCFVRKDDQFVPIERVDKGYEKNQLSKKKTQVSIDRIDELLSEIRNYFYTIEECQAKCDELNNNK